MEIVDVKNNLNYLEEYCKLCSLEWGNPKTEEEMVIYISNKIIRFLLSLQI